MQIHIIFTAVCILLDIVELTSSHTDEGLELLFRQRTNSDWENVWHRESHSRCREKLVRHLFWACEKDIYRLTRRNGMTDVKKRFPGNSIPWLEKDSARNFLRTRRNHRSTSNGGSITAECCTKIGCTWEEYAEYCPSNKRRNHYRT